MQWKTKQGFSIAVDSPADRYSCGWGWVGGWGSGVGLGAGRLPEGLGSDQFLAQTVVFLYNEPAAWTWPISSHAHARQCSHCVSLLVYVCIYTR